MCAEFLFRILLVDLTDDLDPSPARQVHIKQHHIRPGLQNHDDGSVGIGGLADNGDRTADLGLDTGAEHGVIIDAVIILLNLGAFPRGAGGCCEVGCEVGCLVVSVIS